MVPPLLTVTLPPTEKAGMLVAVEVAERFKVPLTVIEPAILSGA